MPTQIFEVTMVDLAKLAEDLEHAYEGPHLEALGQRPTPTRVEETQMGQEAGGAPAEEIVNHPKHYNNHPSGVECITITEWMNFNLGNAVKYIWRAEDKGDQLTNLRKARWYVDREIQRLEKLRVD